MSYWTLFLVETIIYLLFALPASIWDVRKLHIPLFYVCIGIIVALILRIIEFYLFYSFGMVFKSEIVNILIAIASSVLLYFLVRLFTDGGLGIGDIIFGAYTAIYCGFYRNLFATAFAALSGILFYLALSIIQNLRKKRLEKVGIIDFVHRGIFVIPFVPFITFGAVLSALIL